MSSLLSPSPLHTSFISEAIKAVLDTDRIISTSNPNTMQAGTKENSASAEVEKRQIILKENVVVSNSFRKRRMGLGNLMVELPPLPLERDLFIPPVEKGRRTERSISVVTEVLLSMMPKEGGKEVMIKEIAGIINTDIKRVYTIFNVLEGLRMMKRLGQNMCEWQGRKVLMPKLMLLRQMAEKENMLEKMDMANAWEQMQTNQQHQDDIEHNEKVDNTNLNICMLTEKLVMMFLVIPKPKYLTLTVATSVIFGVNQPENKRMVGLQKVLDIAKILQEVAIIQKVKVTVGMAKPVFAYQYVGPEVELIRIVEVDEPMFAGDSESEAIAMEKENACKVDDGDEEGIGGKGDEEASCDGDENEEFNIASEKGKSEQTSLMVMDVGRRVVLKFAGDEVEMMRDC